MKTIIVHFAAAAWLQFVCFAGNTHVSLEDTSLIPLASIILSSSSNSKEFADAKRELTNIPDHGEQLASVLNSAKDRELDGSAVMLIILLQSEEAMKALAPFLFNFEKPAYKTDVRPSCHILIALRAFEEMNLGDAPVQKSLDVSTTLSAIVAWRRWAIRRDLVPKEYEDRVGLPEWLPAHLGL